MGGHELARKRRDKEATDIFNSELRNSQKKRGMEIRRKIIAGRSGAGLARVASDRIYRMEGTARMTRMEGTDKWTRRARSVNLIQMPVK